MIGAVVLAVLCLCGEAPERENDFFWENDRVGFRAYGPGDYHKWSGIDLFIKNTTTNAVVHLLRGHGDYGNWHENKNPLAYDNFTLGAKRGVGAVAVFADGEWKTYTNWESSRVIHVGDDYLAFELVYPACSALGRMTYRVSMLKGNDFFRNDVTFEFPDRMAEGWLVGPGVSEDPNCEAKPFVRPLKGDEGWAVKTNDHLGCEVLGIKTASFSYEAGFKIVEQKERK